MFSPQCYAKTQIFEEEEEAYFANISYCAPSEHVIQNTSLTSPH